LRGLRQERKNPSSAQDFFASPIKEKRAKRFSTLDLKNNSEQCAGFFRVSHKRKTVRPFFASRLHRANPSSAEELCASPIKEKRAKRFSTLDLKNNFEQCGEIASVLIKEKRLGRFSPLDLKNNSEQCAGFFRVSHHTARRKRRTVCPHKEL